MSLAPRSRVSCLGVGGPKFHGPRIIGFGYRGLVFKGLVLGLGSWHSGLDVSGAWGLGVLGLGLKGPWSRCWVVQGHGVQGLMSLILMVLVSEGLSLRGLGF